MSDRLDILIARHLDGSGNADAARELGERLNADPEARRALFLAAAQDVQLKEIFAAEAEGESLANTSVPPLTRSRFACPGEGRVLKSPRRQQWRRSLPAIAAALALVAGGLALIVNRYPAPEISGPCTVVGDGELQRGSVIATEAGRGRIALGGYCRVRMDPRSSVRLGGEKYKEEVFLEHGAVQCQADRGVGRFRVRTDIGVVSVKGTEFEVKMVDRQKESEMFDKRMVVAVLTGSVLISGTWGRQTLRAGQEAMLPPPGVALQRTVESLDLLPDVGAKVDRILAPSNATELRTAYRTQIRVRLFDAARRKLQTTMPKVMPTKVSPKVRAIRSKGRAGPPSAADIALIRMASQKRARKVMMNVLHDTADKLADEAAADDHHIAWLLATQIRAKLPGEKIATFDKAVADAGVSDKEAAYIAKAQAAIDAAIAAYDPDITGIVDPETGKVIVTEAQVGVPVKDDALAERIRRTLTAALAGIADDMGAIAPLLANPKIEAVRARLFEAARKKQITLLPQKMPVLVQSKVMAIRTRLKKGGPPSPQDIAKIQRAMMKRISGTMRHVLHDTADAVAVRAARDEKLVASAVAAGVRAKLAPEKAAGFDAALSKAGITGDETLYIGEVEDRIVMAIDTIDPDLTGIVSPVTGEVIAE